MTIKTWRQKGRKGEYEVLDLLQPIVDKVFEEAGMMRVELRRNENQSGFGGRMDVSGFDVAGLDWLALEIKRQENLNVTGAWLQCKDAALKKMTAEEKKLVKDGHLVERDYERVPVLIWRMNRERWKVRMFGYLTCDGGLAFDEGCGGRIRCPVDIGIEAFLLWFEMKLKWEIRLRRSGEPVDFRVKSEPSEAFAAPDPRSAAEVPNKSAGDQVSDVRSQKGLFDTETDENFMEDPDEV